MAVDKNQRRAPRAAALRVCRMRCVSFHGVFFCSQSESVATACMGCVHPAGGCGFVFFSPVPGRPRAVPPSPCSTIVVGGSWGRVLGLDDSSDARGHLGEGDPQPGLTWSTSPAPAASGVEIGLSSGSAVSLGEWRAAAHPCLVRAVGRALGTAGPVCSCRGARGPAPLLCDCTTRPAAKLIWW